MDGGLGGLMDIYYMATPTRDEKKSLCPCNEGPEAEMGIRVKLFDALRTAALSTGACAACIGTAAAYLAAAVANDDLGASETSFLDVMRTVWRDVKEQRRTQAERTRGGGELH